jgi:hypothetical protein
VVFHDLAVPGNTSANADHLVIVRALVHAAGPLLAVDDDTPLGPGWLGTTTTPLSGP